MAVSPARGGAAKPGQPVKTQECEQGVRVHISARQKARKRELRAGPLRIAAATGVPARTVSRILARNHVPPLAWCDPLTGELIRASRASHHRYERERPGELVHIDVKKLGKIPDGGGWRAEGKNTLNHRSRSSNTRIGYDYVHAVIDDHTRLAYAEIHPDEKGTTAAGVLIRAATFFKQCGIPRIERVISDNAFAYRLSTDFKNAVAQIGAEQRFIKPPFRLRFPARRHGRS